MAVGVFTCMCGEEFSDDGSGCPTHKLKRWCPVCGGWFDWLVGREGRVSVCSACAGLIPDYRLPAVDDELLNAVRRAVNGTAVPTMDPRNILDRSEPDWPEHFGSVVLGYTADGNYIDVAVSDGFRAEHVSQHPRYALYRLFGHAREWLMALLGEVDRLREENAALLARAERAEMAPPGEPHLIEDLRLSSRVYNLLADNDIRTVPELTAMSRTDLLNLPRCGATSVKIIETELDRLGLSLAPERDDAQG